jgi:ubiquinone/menaquinone biosynthesis C-methylase UbiE
MKQSKKFFKKLHTSTSRNYLQRMLDDKIECMKIASKFEKDYWDGDRRYGYGGYKYIKNKWSDVAKKLIKNYKLNNKSKILDIGCGKGYLLYEIKKILNGIDITGIDISKYGLKNAHPEIKQSLSRYDARNKLKFKNKQFDLVISFGTLHNFEIYDLQTSLKEISRVGKKSYIWVESYRNYKELFNLECWALTCKAFFSKKEWLWIFKQNQFKGDYEFIYFN